MSVKQKTNRNLCDRSSGSPLGGWRWKAWRCSSSSERDKTAGTWHAYQIVGGACAVAAGSHGKAADAGGGNAEKNDGRTALNF